MSGDSIEETGQLKQVFGFITGVIKRKKSSITVKSLHFDEKKQKPIWVYDLLIKLNEHRLHIILNW